MGAGLCSVQLVGGLAFWIILAREIVHHGCWLPKQRLMFDCWDHSIYSLDNSIIWKARGGIQAVVIGTSNRDYVHTKLYWLKVLRDWLSHRAEELYWLFIRHKGIKTQSPCDYFNISTYWNVGGMNELKNKMSNALMLDCSFCGYRSFFKFLWADARRTYIRALSTSI